MSGIGLQIPTRNILTGALVNWTEDDTHEERMDGLSLAWKNLTVFRKRKILNGIWRSPTYEEVKILHGVSGIATQGNLIALMGASGAGKTTLLAAISRRDKSDMSGTLMLNGKPASASLVAKISGFVPQQDLAVEELTVGEHMEFMARMMMDRRSSASCRTRRVHQLLTELNVAICMTTKLASLSGGERKRVSLAVQLLNDPPLLFCDEPTTGLDSWAASAVTSRLRRLASAGKMVICSIHQPASGVFDMFHQVIFLAGGRVAFQGTIEEATNFFSGLQYKCPVGFNQAEYYVSRLSVESGRELESHERIRRICDEFRRSKVALEIDRKLEIEVNPNSIASSSIFDTGGTGSDLFERYLTLKKVSFVVQFYWLLWRNIAALRQNYTIWVVEFFLYIGVALLLAIPYMEVTMDLDQRGIQNVEGLMYLIITETIFMFIYSVFITFPHEMPVLLRETANGLYAPAPYYLSKMIFWIPRAVISPTLFASLIFSVVGLQGGVQGWAGLTFICILCANYANAYGSFLSATFESLATASMVSIPFDLLGITYSGAFGEIESSTPVLSWIKYISPFYYGTEAISILQWVNIEDIKCVNVTGMPCIKTGNEVLARFGYSEDHFWQNVFGLCCMYVIGHSIAYAMVCRRSRRSPVY